MGLHQMSPAFLCPVHFPFPQPMVAVYNAGMEPQAPKPTPKPIVRPTPEEVRRAHGQITADGLESQSPNLSLLAITDPIVKEAIQRHAENGIRLGLVGKSLPMGGGDSFSTVHAMTCGAILWGLHLGLHIGQNRAAVWIQQPGETFVLPNYCGWCGVRLMGGATKHTPNCEIQKIIEEATRA